MSCLYRNSSKGQFFILGAIMIVLAVYFLSGTLQRGKGVDPSFVQNNEALWLIAETEAGLHDIAMFNLTEDSMIREYVEAQSEIAIEYGYLLDFRMKSPFQPYSVFPNKYTIVVKSKDIYIEKYDRLYPYYYNCLDTENDGLCSSLDILEYGYQDACCGVYGICC